MKKLSTLLIILIINLPNLFSQNDSLNDINFNISITFSGILQTGEISRLISNNILDVNVDYKNNEFKQSFYYTYGLVGAAGKFPDKNLENEFTSISQFYFLDDNLVHPALLMLYEQSNLRALDSRVGIAIGARANVCKDKNNTIHFLLAYANENNSYRVIENNNVNRIIFRVSGKDVLIDKSLFLDYFLMYQPSANDFDDYRIRGMLKVSLKISKYLALSGVYSYLYDSIIERNKSNVNTQLSYGLSFNF